MRAFPLIALLIAAAAVPAAAQDGPLDQRVGRLEKEMRAVQRKVFPGGAGATVEPEIRPATPVAGQDGVPATSSINDLTARVDSLERQLATLTGQVEQNGFKLRQLEEGMAKLRGDTEYRLTTLEGGTPRTGRAAEPAAPVRTPTAPPAADRPPVREPAAPPAPAATTTGDAGEDAYMTGYRLWEAKRYAEAETALKAVVAKYPKHKRASYAQNLLGRSYLDDGKPAMAAEAFLANYKKMPRGERAPDSLYYLGQALTRLNKPADACKVYDELADVYGEKINQALKDRVAQGRATAKCGA